MRRFQIGSPKFEGIIEVVYNSAEELLSVNFGNTVLSMAHKAAMLNLLSNAIHLDSLHTSFSATKVIIAEFDFEVNFEMFWHEYPYSRNKHLALPIFDKLSKSVQIQAWEAAKAYRDHCKRNTWYKPKLAAQWLKDREYLNDWKTL